MLHNKNKPALSNYKPKLLSAYQDFKRSDTDGPTRVVDWQNNDGGIFSQKRTGNGRFPFRRPRNNGLVFKRVPSWWPFELVDKKSYGVDDEIVDESCDDGDDEAYDSRSFDKKADFHQGRQGAVNLENLGASLYKA